MSINNNYHAQFYETETTCPYTCSVTSIICHGIIYTYRKSWIRRKPKVKNIFHVSETCYNYYSREAREQAMNKVKQRIEEVLNFLNESKHIKQESLGTSQK